MKLRLIVGSVLLSMAVPMQQSRSADPPTADEERKLEFFEKKIRPILAKHCFECHGPDTQEGGLRLDRRDTALAGGDSGPAIVPGEPDQGFLIDAINYGEVYQMPPTGKLPEADIALIKTWVRQGAVWPEDQASPNSTPGNGGGFDLHQRTSEHWSWKPLSNPPLPKVDRPDWPLTPVDFFILEELQQQQLEPAPSASRATWLRRVTFDLIGLPPQPEEVRAFLNDKSPLAFEKVVDRLLASPHFGERWARHWLDLMRYAESKGHEFDYPIPNAHEYRDYVIRALNADLPFNQFVIEHLAGDLLSVPRTHPVEGFNESILGTGFWHLGEEVHSPVDIRGDETDRIDNKIDVFTKSFLGLTVACARCHDHKFDAITTKDYYALSGFLMSSRYRQARFDTELINRQIAEELDHADRQTQQRFAKVASETWTPVVARLTEYLLAARDVIAGIPASERSNPTVIQRQADRVAADHQLSPTVVTAWVKHLLNEALVDPSEPLHPWSQLVLQVQGNVEEQGTALAVDGLASPENSVLMDYSQLRAGHWITDGWGFGLRPKRAGELRFTRERSAQVCTIAAAEYDPAWDRLSLHPGTVPEPGKLSQVTQAGRTLHTPTFEMPVRKLYYLVRGAGFVYASVDSHRMVNGPLHGSVVKQWKAKDRIQWIEHDLATYAGHRVHLEFTPKEDEQGRRDFALAMVVAANQMPPLPDPERVELELPKEAFSSAEQMARSIGARFERVLNNLGSIGEIGQAENDAAFVQWMMEHPELVTENGASEKLQAFLQQAAKEREQIAAKIRSQSRTAPVLMDGSGVDGHVLVRGNHKILGQSAPRQFLEAMPELAVSLPETGSGRLQLAKRVTDPENPYVSRVIVNRLWHHLFGRGIVPTVDNFGYLGERPSHPELLDYLARWFIEHDWSIKQTLRMLVLSRTYRMSSVPITGQDLRDPQNRWLHHMPVRRLQAEAIRDSILAVSERLDRRQFGPSVPVYLTTFMEGRGRPESGPLDGDGRRSIYLAIRRNFLTPMLLVFDAPIPFTSMGRRSVSNVPAQALTLMNDPFVVEQATRWANRILSGPGDTNGRVRQVFLTAFSRLPDDDELTAATEFLAEQGRDYGLSAEQSFQDVRTWTDLCHSLINSKEFIFLP